MIIGSKEWSETTHACISFVLKCEKFCAHFLNEKKNGGIFAISEVINTKSTI